MRFAAPVLGFALTFLSPCGVATAQNIPCAERAPPPAVPPEQQLRQRTGLTLTAETTYAEVVAALGAPTPNGLAGEMPSYRVRVEGGSLIDLWLSFEPSGDRKLTRALLRYLDRPYCMFWETTVLLNTLAITKARRRDQLDFARPLTPQDVVDAWGPPDDAWGSGIYRFVYDMADGRVVQVWVYRGRAVLAPGSEAPTP